MTGVFLEILPGTVFIFPALKIDEDCNVLKLHTLSKRSLNDVVFSQSSIATPSIVTF